MRRICALIFAMYLVHRLSSPATVEAGTSGSASGSASGENTDQSGGDSGNSGGDGSSNDSNESNAGGDGQESQDDSGENSNSAGGSSNAVSDTNSGGSSGQEDGATGCSNRYNGNCYTLAQDEKLKWSECESYCAENNLGMIADIFDADETDHVLNILQNNPCDNGKVAWVGLTDEDDEGVWKNADGDVISIEQIFANVNGWSESDLGNSNSKDCLSVRQDVNDWKADKCNDKAKCGCLCKQQAPATTILPTTATTTQPTTTATTTLPTTTATTTQPTTTPTTTQPTTTATTTQPTTTATTTQPTTTATTTQSTTTPTTTQPTTTATTTQPTTTATTTQPTTTATTTQPTTTATTTQPTTTPTTTQPTTTATTTQPTTTPTTTQPTTTATTTQPTTTATSTKPTTTATTTQLTTTATTTTATTTQLTTTQTTNQPTTTATTTATTTQPTTTVTSTQPTTTTTTTQPITTETTTHPTTTTSTSALENTLATTTTATTSGTTIMPTHISTSTISATEDVRDNVLFDLSNNLDMSTVSLWTGESLQLRLLVSFPTGSFSLFVTFCMPVDDSCTALPVVGLATDTGGNIETSAVSQVVDDSARIVNVNFTNIQVTSGSNTDSENSLAIMVDVMLDDVDCITNGSLIEPEASAHYQQTSGGDVTWLGQQGIIPLVDIGYPHLDILTTLDGNIDPDHVFNGDDVQILTSVNHSNDSTSRAYNVTLTWLLTTFVEYDTMVHYQGLDREPTVNFKDTVLTFQIGDVRLSKTVTLTFNLSVKTSEYGSENSRRRFIGVLQTTFSDDRGRIGSASTKYIEFYHSSPSEVPSPESSVFPLQSFIVKHNDEQSLYVCVSRSTLNDHCFHLQRSGTTEQVQKHNVKKVNGAQEVSLRYFTDSMEETSDVAYESNGVTWQHRTNDDWIVSTMVENSDQLHPWRDDGVGISLYDSYLSYWRCPCFS
ncbi:mucin-22-like [Ptychodera flava]|uniref:mucin-22-like n=1 Tax=Ptychodera flava TaxID=63121 RepID=UPI00396A7F63